MSESDHNPAPRREQAPARIGVRALLSAGEHTATARPQVALVIPLPGRSEEAPQQLRLSVEEAGELAGRLLAFASMARYDAAVHAALARRSVIDEQRDTLLATLDVARAQIQEPS